MKMSAFWILITELALVRLALTTNQNSEHLYVVENVSSENSTSRQLICMSEEDDAALIWNHDLTTKEYSNQYENFEPTNRTIRNSPGCAIWKSEKCLVSWKEENDWDVVNSLVKPMGPVVDYRWEDFGEFVLNNVSGQDYQNVLLLDSLNGNLVFSVRGTGYVGIYLCDNEDPTTSSCFLIKLAVKGTFSAIGTCLGNESSSEQHNGNRSCEIVNTFTHKTPVLNAYEWRTFRLQWISDEKMIKLFSDNEEEAFLQANVQEWHTVRAVLVNSETPARFKFHFYGYLMATSKNAQLTTADFDHSNENFCANMLVSLCAKCSFNVSLTNSENGSLLSRMVVSGDENHHPSGWRTWQSMKLNMTLQSPLPRSLRLQVTSVGDEDSNEEFWWAIDNLRVCEKNDGVKESTITIPISSGLINDQPNIKCQKLINGRILVADLASNKPSNDTDQLKKFIREHVKLCPPGCVISSKADEDPSDCKCVQEPSEYYEDGCVDIVPGKRNITLVQGLNSTMCENCNGSYRVEVWEKVEQKKLGEQVCSTLECTYSSMLKPYTAYNVQVMCPNGTVILKKNITTLESAPGMIRNLTFESIFADNVTGKWESPLERNGYIRNYTVTIQRIKLIGCEDLHRITPSEPKSVKTVTEMKALFNGLHPYAEYNFTVIANTVEPGIPLSVVFATHQLDHPTAKVSNLRVVNDSYIAWDHPEDCTEITGPVDTTELLVSGVSDWVKNWLEAIVTNDTRYDLETENLLPYTRYKVRAYLTSGFYNKTVNHSDYQEVYWTTAPTAPPAVRNLTIYEANVTENMISARWEPPYPAHGEIESYHLLLSNNNSVFENRSIEASEVKNCTSFDVCVEDLSLPRNISTTGTNLELQVFARNANVSTDGVKTSKWFNIDDL